MMENSRHGIRLPWELTAGLLLLGACSGSQADRDVEEGSSEAERPSFGSETAGQDIGALDERLAVQGLQNQGCMRIEVLGSVELQHPGGQVLVMTAQLCADYEDEGQIAFLATAVGTEFVMSNTLHPLPGVGGGYTDQVQLVSLTAPRASRRGPNIVVVRYRTPPEDAGDGPWLEQLVVGNFSADALDLAVTQPLSFDVRVGGGRLRGEGDFELADSDGDGDLDLTMTLSATGEGCRSNPCRNGQHRCEVTVPWRSRGYEVELTGDDCLYLGRLDL